MAISMGYGGGGYPEDRCRNCGYPCRDYDRERYEMRRMLDEMRYLTKEIMYQHRSMMMRSPVAVPDKPMGKLTALAKRILDPDTRALVEAGWLNSDLSIASEGRDAFLSHYLQANKKELAEEARKRVAEKKEEEEE